MPSRIRSLLLAAWVLPMLGLPLIAQQPPAMPATRVESFTTKERTAFPAELATRTWTEFRSSRYDNRGGTRLFIVIPRAREAGVGAVERSFRDLAEWKELAERDGAVLVLPDPGPDRTWDASDLPYLEAVYQHCSTSYAIEGASRYLAAYGDGGIPASLLAIKRTNLMAAAAFIDAQVVDPHPLQPNPTVPLAVLSIGGRQPSMERLVAHFRKANGTDHQASLDSHDLVHRKSGASPWNQDFTRSHFVRVVQKLRTSVPTFVYTQLFRTVARWKTLVGEGTLRAKVRADAHPGLTRLREPGTPEREAFVYVPSKFRTTPPRTPLPLVMLFHGVTCNGEYFQDQTEWYRTAEAQGFIVYAATAPGFRWGMSPADLAHVSSVITRLTTEGLPVAGHTLPIDPARVYLYGFSNGSFFISRFVHAYPEQIAAAALWAGAYDPDKVPVKAGKPLPLWYGIGLEDPYFPSWEKEGKTFVDYFCRLGGCDPARTRKTTHAAFGRENLVTTWIHEGDAVEVRYSEARGIEHGNLNELPQHIWCEFFSRFRKREGQTVRIPEPPSP